MATMRVSGIGPANHAWQNSTGKSRREFAASIRLEIPVGRPMRTVSTGPPSPTIADQGARTDCAGRFTSQRELDATRLQTARLALPRSVHSINEASFTVGKLCPITIQCRRNMASTGNVGCAIQVEPGRCTPAGENPGVTRIRRHTPRTQSGILKRIRCRTARIDSSPIAVDRRHWAFRSVFRCQRASHETRG